MAGFYSARSGMIPPLPWPNFAPPFPSARHSFVSTLQAQGVEVGLVAKLAGHANPAVTLGHYTQAVRGGAGALALLDAAYGGGPVATGGAG